MSFSQFSGVASTRGRGGGGTLVSFKCWNKASGRSFKITDGHVVVVVSTHAHLAILIFKRCVTYRIVALSYLFYVSIFFKS